MLIRDFPSCIESVSDIQQITEKRRYVIIFKYDSPQHFFSNYCCDNISGNYDMYLINESVVHGKNFMVPYGITLFSRNTYRGIARNPLIDEKINYESEVFFLNGSYSNRIHKDNGEVFRISLPTILESCGGLGTSTIEEEAMRLLNSQAIQPFPKFYNVEDQAYYDLKGTGEFVGDFTYDQTEVPNYKLRDLVDEYTRFAVVEMPNVNQLVSISLSDSIAAEGYTAHSDNPNIKFNNGLDIELETFKESVTWLFLKANQYLMDSVFSSMDVIVDVEDASFNIPLESLKLKYREISKSDMTKDYALLISRMSEIVDRQFGELDVPDSIYMNNLCPDRIMMHISNTGCKIRVTNTRKMFKTGKHLIMPISATSSSSMSDTDEMVTTHCSDLGGF